MLPNALREPWAITHDGFKVVLGVASRGASFADAVRDARERALAARDGRPLENTRTVELVDGVAVIPVQGPLFRHASMMTDLSGATSYATLRKDFQAALDNPAVSAILFDIDSPGGEAKGCAELAQAIFEARGVKPLVAYTGGMCASAAYWIASACDRLVVEEGAQVGSIGVIATYLDDSKALEMEGLKEIDFVSSQSPHKKPDLAESEDDRARFQKRIDAMGQRFVETMARNRGVTTDHVLAQFGRGDVLMGRDALAARLVDEIGNYEAVLAALAADQGEDDMDLEKMAAVLKRDGASEDELVQRAASMAVFEASVLAAAGTEDHGEALTRIAAGQAALGELATIRAAQVAAAAAARQGALRACLEKAIAEDRLQLGVLAETVPSLLDDESADQAAKAVEACADQTAPALLDAICGVPVSERAVARVGGFVAKLPSGLPAAIREPAPEHTSAPADADEARISELAKRNRATLGLSK